MPDFKRIEDADNLAGKTALVRVDFNVPVAGGKVTDDTRLRAALDTVNALSGKGAKVALLAHFGRPKGEVKPELSLRPVADAFAGVLGAPVAFAADCVGEQARHAIDSIQGGGVVLLENTRFKPGEEKNDEALAIEMAKLGDLYVNDAFSAAHRAHVTTEALARKLPAYAGRAMERELDALEAALGNPERPVLAVVGGAKVSTKIDLLSHLVTTVDALAIGGGMANTFLAAQGRDVGKSLCEHDLADTARAIMKDAEKAGCAVVLPVDAVVARAFEAGADSETVAVDAVPADAMILDVGPQTLAAVTGWLDKANTVVWNGPLGAFEIEPFDRATLAAARHAAALTREGTLVSVAGGGDTVAALNKAGVADAFSYVSTAGGAFLEWMEGKTLPGVAALMR